MPKVKERSELEFLKATVRQQRSLIKQLRKEISRHTKRAHQYSDLEEKQLEIDSIAEAEKSQPIVKVKDPCPRCGAPLELVEIGVKILIRCSSCEYRTIKK